MVTKSSNATSSTIMWFLWASNSSSISSRNVFSCSVPTELTTATGGGGGTADLTAGMGGGATVGDINEAGAMTGDATRTGTGDTGAPVMDVREDTCGAMRGLGPAMRGVAVPRAHSLLLLLLVAVGVEMAGVGVVVLAAGGVARGGVRGAAVVSADPFRLLGGVGAAARGEISNE